ncbi:MAG TPA: PRC-barrel domain-containing protein [Desulfomonilaceae bacterium]|nr:PRC-barrel domain-containing protein [Desulfomonilaceae bacterium]
MRTSLTIIIGTAITFLVASWMFSPNQVFAKASISASSHASGVVIGRPVRSERGAVLGTVENIVLNDSGCAQFVVISGQFPGARSMWYPIPWRVISRSTPEAIFVNVEPDVLVRAPSFSRKKFPDLLHSDFNAKVNTFFQTRTNEEKVKTEGRVKEKDREWRAPATEGTVAPEEKVKDKALMERERKLKPSVTTGESAVKQQESDIKSKQQLERQQIEREHGKVTPVPSQMMERDRPHMERGMMGQGKGEKEVPSQSGVTVTPGQAGEKIK